MPLARKHLILLGLVLLVTALAPVIAGMLVYSIASSALMSREYEELMMLIRRKLSRKKDTAESKG